MGRGDGIYRGLFVRKKRASYELDDLVNNKGDLVEVLVKNHMNQEVRHMGHFMKKTPGCLLIAKTHVFCPQSLPHIMKITRLSIGIM